MPRLKVCLERFSRENCMTVKSEWGSKYHLGNEFQNICQLVIIILIWVNGSFILIGIGEREMQCKLINICINGI